jgi:hypothetical protein
LRRLGAWATIAVATLKDLAPYAAIELLLPGDVDGAYVVVLSAADESAGFGQIAEYSSITDRS